MDAGMAAIPVDGSARRTGRDRLECQQGDGMLIRARYDNVLKGLGGEQVNREK
jgi:hypothetical protein